MESSPRGSRWFTPEMITALSAVLVGVCAIGVSVYQVSVMQAHQQASVWPFVQGGWGYTEDHVRVYIANSGVGPAKIKHVSLLYKGEPQPDWNTLFNTMGLGDIYYTQSQLNGRVMPAEDIVEMVTLPMSEWSEAFYNSSEDLLMTICYCSVYDSCWESQVFGGERGWETALEVKECLADERTRFKQ